MNFPQLMNSFSSLVEEVHEFCDYNVCMLPLFRDRTLLIALMTAQTRSVLSSEHIDLGSVPEAEMSSLWIGDMNHQCWSLIFHLVYFTLQEM